MPVTRGRLARHLGAPPGAGLQGHRDGRGFLGPGSHPDDLVPDPAPANTFTTQVYEGYGQTFGVGMPGILYFSHPIRNRAAVERSLQLRTSRPVTGAWYWPDLTQKFRIGGSLIVTARTATHHMHVYRNGHLLYTWPISTVPPGDDTPDGTCLTIDKGNPVLMTGPGYSLEVPWPVRFTWTGDYLHDACWSVGKQGAVNVSHGCVNMAPADAQTCYQMENSGDPVMITGSPAPGTWTTAGPCGSCLEETGAGQRPGDGGAGRPGRQHVHQPVLRPPVHRVLPAADREAGQCRRGVTGRASCPGRLRPRSPRPGRTRGDDTLPPLIP